MDLNKKKLEIRVVYYIINDDTSIHTKHVLLFLYKNINKCLQV